MDGFAAGGDGGAGGDYVVDHENVLSGKRFRIFDAIGCSSVDPSLHGAFAGLSGVAANCLEVVGNRKVGNLGQAEGEMVGLVVATPEALECVHCNGHNAVNRFEESIRLYFHGETGGKSSDNTRSASIFG